jgi:hypothetical protein
LYLSIKLIQKCLICWRTGETHPDFGGPGGTQAPRHGLIIGLVEGGGLVFGFVLIFQIHFHIFDLLEVWVP